MAGAPWRELAGQPCESVIKKYSIKIPGVVRGRVFFIQIRDDR